MVYTKVDYYSSKNSLDDPVRYIYHVKGRSSLTFYAVERRARVIVMVANDRSNHGRYLENMTVLPVQYLWSFQYR
jgi:hypothetical protein